MRSLLVSAVVAMSALGLPLLAGPSAARADEAPARFRVLLPPDATLTVDGAPTQAKSAERDFVTPPLQEGKDFHYDLKAHFARDGNEVTVQRRITVRAGQQTVADLNLSGAAGNQAFYYAPPSPAAGLTYYYSPATTWTYAPFYRSGPVLNYDFRPVRGYVGGARDNWKPDYSDPFFNGGHGPSE